ncbi:hypothetical protein Q1695_012651 [Nippostrongylus brasiliensis]|nr:hypothetical protein Q1695_012651 [Nippostrongylus brasiliensis]
MWSGLSLIPSSTRKTIYFGLLVLGYFARALIDENDCGVMKGCVSVPEGCRSTANCEISFSYQVNGTYLNMELDGALPQTNRYIAVGFSRDYEMGQDMVVYCASYNGRVEGGLAINGDDRSNSILDSTAVQEITRTNVSDGHIYCSIRQLLNPLNATLFNLNSSYVLLFAAGPYSKREIHYHSSRYVTARTALAVNVSESNEDATANEYDWPKTAHGILMVFSWTAFLTTGMMSARVKEGPCSCEICKLQMWFHCHRTLNIIGILGTIAGLLCILKSKQWRWTGPLPGRSVELIWQWGSIHSFLGLIACVLAWIQPFDAMLRCHPGTPARPIFNFAHGGIGVTAWLCSAAAAFIATRYFAGMFSSPETAQWLFISFLLDVAVCVFAIEVLTLMSRKKEKSDNSTSSEPHESSQQSYSSESSNNSSEREEYTKCARRAQGARLLAIAFHVAVAVGISIGLSVLILKRPTP